MKHIFTIFAAMLFFMPFVRADFVLPPKDATFFVVPVVLSSCQDFTSSKQFLCLEGEKSFLTVKWTANYFDNTERTIGVKCYFNCPQAGSSIETQCASAQSCQYLGLVGSHSCTISNPQYQYTLPPGSYNNITCKFYDPNNFDDKGKPLEFVPYPSRIFRPINYSISISPITATLGQPFNFPISVVPLGLFSSDYSFSLSELTQPPALSIDRTSGNTEKLGYSQPGRFSPRVTYLVAKSATVRALVTANADFITCNADSDCSYLGDAVCVSNKCWQKADIQLKTGKASLSEFDIFGFLQIMLLSVLVLFVLRRK